MSRSVVMGWFGLLVVGFAAPAIAATGVPSPTQMEVEQAVIAAIPAWHGQKATILKYLDLTRLFDTASPWALVAAQDPQPPAEQLMEGPGPIAICFVKALQPRCFESYGGGLPSTPAWYTTTYDLIDAKVVSSGHGKPEPLLLLKTCSERSLDGNCDIRMVLYAYAHGPDAFRQVFVFDTGGSNNNQDARFVEHGPLRGDVIVDYPTNHAPYTYWIEVYAPGKSGQYARILKYRSHTRYGDGNPLPVADSEMPAIMQRLGLWKPGDALPVPLKMPSGCGRLVLRHGEEWCQNLCQPLPGSDCTSNAGRARIDSRSIIRAISRRPAPRETPAATR